MISDVVSSNGLRCVQRHLRPKAFVGLLGLLGHASTAHLRPDRLMSVWTKPNEQIPALTCFMA